jgi:phage shock protein E
MPNCRFFLTLTLFALLSPQVFAGESGHDGGLPDYDLELASRLIKNGAALLLDIRTDEEFKIDHITGSTFIPFLNFTQYLLKISELTNGSKDCPIVLYCRTGRRAGIVKKVLLQEGYTQVTNMGGLKDWRSIDGK